jgi:hypothetical protein
MQIMHNDDPSRLCFLLESAEAAAYRAQPKRAAWLLPIIRRLSSTAAPEADWPTYGSGQPFNLTP